MPSCCAVSRVFSVARGVVPIRYVYTEVVMPVPELRDLRLTFTLLPVCLQASGYNNYCRPHCNSHRTQKLGNLKSTVIYRRL